MIKAPFNFVPLSEKVFFPSWASKISHDVPFEDGISGTIDLTITAQTPIFVRNGHTQKDSEDKNEAYKSFSNIDGNYFIPASSIKGAIRNVLEIISFGKMQQINNNRYSIRDLKLTKDYLSTFQNNEVHCGWMSIKDSAHVQITDNGVPLRISLGDIDEKFGTQLDALAHNGEKLKNDENRSALYKINALKGKNLHCTVCEVKKEKDNPVDKRKFSFFCDSNYSEAVSGTLVVTGQCGVRKDKTKERKAEGKYFEFIFPDKEVAKPIELDIFEENGMYEDFCFVYKDSDVWKYWQKEMYKDKPVPVFFIKKGEELLHLGLSYLYKLPYPKRTQEYLPEEHRSKKADLAECIFGSVRNDFKLKGRVSFSHAICIDEGDYVDSKDPYMSSPKSNYYPIYLEQKKAEGNGFVKFERDIVDGKPKGSEKPVYTTMMDKTALLRGYKRYPVQKCEQEEFFIPQGQEENTSPFVPLGIGAVFSCPLRFHNLRPEELGALLRAITVGQCHSIGFAKSYGYGKVKISLGEMRLIGNDKSYGVDDLQTVFENTMVAFNSDYKKSPQIVQLKAMMRDQVLIRPMNRYMELEDFVGCKKNGEYLQPYTEYIKKTEAPKPIVQDAVAQVVLIGKIKQAKLLEGKDLLPKELEVLDKSASLKMLDKIIVEVIVNKGGKITKLRYKNKA